MTKDVLFKAPGSEKNLVVDLSMSLTEDTDLLSMGHTVWKGITLVSGGAEGFRCVLFWEMWEIVHAGGGRLQHHAELDGEEHWA